MSMPFSKVLTHLVPSPRFPYPLKHQKTDAFGRYRKGAVGTNRLKQIGIFTRKSFILDA